jgi:hypothetical protein
MGWGCKKDMTTPESKIKERVKKLLAKYNCYQFWPVQMGIGAAGLDCHAYVPGVAMGLNIPVAFFVETKAYGKEPTPRQRLLMQEHDERNCNTFVVDNDGSLQELEDWLKSWTRK